MIRTRSGAEVERGRIATCSHEKMCDIVNTMLLVSCSLRSHLSVCPPIGAENARSHRMPVVHSPGCDRANVTPTCSRQCATPRMVHRG